MISVEQTRALRPAIRIGAYFLLGILLYKSKDVAAEQAALGLVVAAAALFPTLVWAAGATGGGLPIYPLMSLTYVWTSALPLLSDHPEIQKYSGTEQVFGTASVVVFLFAGTAAWWTASRRTAQARETYVGFPEGRGQSLFFAFLTFSCLTHTSLWWDNIPQLSQGFYTAIRSASISVAMLSTCILMYRWGARQLSLGERAVTASLIVCYCFLDMAALMIHGAMAISAVAFTTFTLGRARPPVAAVLVAFAVFSILHAGKWPMRQQYWKNSSIVARQDNHIEFFTEWFGHGIKDLVATEEHHPGRSSKPSSVLQRTSVIQMLLLVQKKTPDTVPFLLGETYATIPELLIPRVLHPNKPMALESTYALGIAYGLQDRKSTYTTTIAFGPVAEAYANFGTAGVIGLGILLGTTLGRVAETGKGVPITSFRALWSLLAMTLAINAEATLGIQITSFAQSSMLLGLLGVLTMSRQNVPTQVPPAGGGGGV